MRAIDADAIEYTHAVARNLFDGHNWNELVVTKDEIEDMPTIQPEPHWIPVTERLPKEEGFYLVTLGYKHGAETNIRYFKIEYGETYWSVWGNENITAWMPLPLPEHYKGVTT